MSKYKNGYLTKASLTSEIKKVIAKKHGLKISDILINWMSRWELVTYPTGLIAKAAKIKVHAEGFKSQIFIVEQIANQKWYMK